MKTQPLLILVIVSLASYTANAQLIPKKNILDSVFAKFADVKNICYTERFVFTNTTDTAILYKYFEKHDDSTGYMLSYNVANYRFDKLYYQGVFNASENKLYWHSDSETSITDYNKPPKYMKGISEISFSLLTYVKYLKQTLRDYPQRVSVEDTLIDSKELYKIAFSNPDGLPISGMPLLLLNDTEAPPLRLIINKTTALPEYSTWGYMTYKHSDIILNCNENQRIWSADSEYLPEYFKSVTDEKKEFAPFVAEAGKDIPKVIFKTLQNKNSKLPNKESYHLIAFLSDKCGASIAELSVLNELSKNSTLHVTGVFFETDPHIIPDLIKKYNVTFEVLQNTDSSLSEKVKGFPVNYLYNKEGELIYFVLGNMPDLDEKIINKLE